jgi:hypothetical protein
MAQRPAGRQIVQRLPQQSRDVKLEVPLKVCSLRENAFRSTFFLVFIPSMPGQMIGVQKKTADENLASFFVLSHLL